ncbi:MAG: NADH:flavin oxidoreductase/NADH oxidase family protein [Gammaproteobacteria bacterium]|nr:NADH:flavin oxidoreductase/NADH oxidase family protein [Gammaproteobacteria bacterium]
MDITDALELPCGARLKNRLAKAAMTEGLAASDHSATSRHATLYRRWAHGGAGMLLTGNIMVDRRYLERPANLVIDGPQSSRQMSALRELAQAGTENGAHLWAQLSHAGRQTPKMVAAQPVGPSAVTVKLPGGQFARPRALEAAEIEDIIGRFVHAANVVKEAGFTGVQIHSAHGYLISEFLNPLTNQRTDQWGGSLENRARLLLRTVAAVRKAVGDKYPVSVKLNSSDFQKGGYTFSECLQVVEWLDNGTIDLLEISGGSYEQPMMMGMEGLEPAVEKPLAESTAMREAYFLEYAGKIAETVGTPLMVTGGFRSRQVMDAALVSGAADVIGIARPLCVDVDVPNQLLNGILGAAPAWEKGLSLGPGIFGARSRVPLLKAVNGFAAMAFFYQNIYRLADGLATKSKMALLPALIRHQRGEMRAARQLDSR